MARRRRAWFFLGLFLVLVGAGAAVRRQLPGHLDPLTDFGVLPVASRAAGEPEVPETEAGRAILAHLASIEATTTSDRYAHQTDVDEREGRYHWDCSGMVGWLVRRHAPTAFATLGRGRPVAADFARTIQREGRGWRRIEDLSEVRAGDVFAWRSLPSMRSSNSTGHVGFVLAAPRRALSLGDVWELRIADSTTLPHDRDARTTRGDLDGGLGTGVMTFVRAEGGASHYGWHGVLSPLYVEADVVFGRLEG